MKGRGLMLWSACTLVVLITAFAQTDVNQAENPPAADEWEPATAVTPTSDAEANAAGQPLPPQAPGESPRTEAGETMQPETVAPAQEAVVPDQAVPPGPSTSPRIPAEPSRKLWRFSPLFSAGVYYDDNIFLENTDRVADVIWKISFGLAFDLGDFRGGSENYLTAYWVGGPVFYTDNSEENSFDQSASLMAQYRWEKLVGQLESGFRVASDGNREVNTITTTTSILNTLRFQYDYSGKTSFDLQFAQTYSESSDPSGSTSAMPTPTPAMPTPTPAMPTPESGQTTNNQYEVKAGMNYQIFPKTKIGLELVGGIRDQNSTPLGYYQQTRLRARYVATGKLDFKFSGGVEFLKFQGSDMIKISPVFSLGLEYRPSDGSTVSLVGYRNVYAATALIGQDITATGFEIAATQRILQKFIAGISFGYENDVYFATGEGFATSEGTSTDTNRVDNYTYVRPRLSYSFVKWVSVSVFYEFRRVDSNQTTSSFYDNRFGMEVATEF